MLHVPRGDEPCTGTLPVSAGPFTQSRLVEVRPRTEPSGRPRSAPLPQRGIRTDLVARVRREIAEGRYDTPEKWEAALDRCWPSSRREVTRVTAERSTWRGFHSSFIASGIVLHVAADRPIMRIKNHS